MMQRSTPLLPLYTVPPQPWGSHAVDALLCALDAMPDRFMTPRETVIALKQAFPALCKSVITDDEVERRLRILDLREGVPYFRSEVVKDTASNVGLHFDHGETQEPGDVLPSIKLESLQILHTVRVKEPNSALAGHLLTPDKHPKNYRASWAGSVGLTHKNDLTDAESQEVGPESRGVKHGMAIHGRTSSADAAKQSNDSYERVSAEVTLTGVANEPQMNEPLLNGSQHARRPISESISGTATAYHHPAGDVDKSASERLNGGWALSELQQELNEIGKQLQPASPLSRAAKHGYAMQRACGIGTDCQPALHNSYYEQQDDTRTKENSDASRITDNDIGLLPKPLSVASLSLDFSRDSTLHF